MNNKWRGCLREARGGGANESIESPTRMSTHKHSNEQTGDGFTILEKAIVEHNMVAASKVYDNIRFAELGA